MENEITKNLPPQTRFESFGNTTLFEVSVEDISKVCKYLYFDCELPIKTMTATDEGNDTFKILYVFGIPGQNIFLVPYLKLTKTTNFPSLANEIHELSNSERKIHTFFGLTPEGLMDQRPIILHENWPTDIYPLRKSFKWNDRPAETKGTYNFGKVDGEGIYEIPVGPVHAGIIEPGHFRFSVAGEEIMLLEAQLGFVHKGTEKLFETLPLDKKLKLSEKVSGDSAFSHSLAFCQAIENLANLKVPTKAKWLRVIFNELERLANHFGDIGFMMLDTGFSFGGSNGQRLREMIMQWNEKLTGSRFLRGVNTFGGVTVDISEEYQIELKNELEKILKDFNEIIEFADGTNSLQNRLETTGYLDQTIARDHGVIGVAGRAAGIMTDARIDFPYAAYDQLKFEISREESSDVNARFKVRIKEIRSSIKMIIESLTNLSESGTICDNKGVTLAKNAHTVSIVEGWRGDIVYFVITDKNGEITRVDVRDPSFRNWSAVGYAGKGNVVPDFPLINKSFNLSYSGNDL